MGPRDLYSTPAELAAATVGVTMEQQNYLRHLVHRQVVEVPPGQRALFLAPHPDDIVLGCGGTILKLLARGVSCRLVYLTDGRAVTDEAGEDAMDARRAAEAKAVSAALGAEEPILLDWNERTFTAPEHKAELVDAVEGLLRANAPEAVFLPYLYDQHGDHRYANHLLAAALERLETKPNVYGYEVWSFAPPGLVVDISAELEGKKELMRNYASQLEFLDYLQLIDVVGRLHGPLAPGAEACEAFFPFDPDAYIALVSELDLETPASRRSEVILMPPETWPKG